MKSVSDQDPKGLERMVKDVPMWVSSPDWERVSATMPWACRAVSLAPFARLQEKLRTLLAQL